MSNDRKNIEREALVKIKSLSKVKICLLPFSNKISNQKIKDFFTINVLDLVGIVISILVLIFTKIHYYYFSPFSEEKEKKSSRRLFFEILFVIAVIMIFYILVPVYLF